MNNGVSPITTSEVVLERFIPSPDRHSWLPDLNPKGVPQKAAGNLLALWNDSYLDGTLPHKSMSYNGKT